MLEVTEPALIGELTTPTGAESIAELGVKIALDDFGGGYSTLAHLQQVRPDILKIDRTFTLPGDTGSRDRELVAAVTAMAHVLGM